jgi:hypothetical protein
MSSYPVFRLNLRYDLLSFLNGEQDPPCKCRLFIDASCNCVLGNLNGVTVLGVPEGDPSSATVFSLDE